MPPKPEQFVEILTAQLGDRKLTPAQWHRLERFLDAWQDEVLAAARRHPPRSYDLGRAQAEAFAKLIGDLQGELPSLSFFGGPSETRRQAVAWQQEYLLNELRDALAKYVGQIKDALLYGMRLGLNPTQVASRLYNATQDATVNWRAITRTEMVRANAAGRLASCREMGFEKVWAPPHAGACKRCRQLLENKVFLISEVENVTNFGRHPGEWVACIPLHPHCRHAWLPYDADVYDIVMAQYRDMEAAGLTDDAFLDEAFDSSGQLKPEYSDHDFSAAKTLAVAGLTAGVWVAKRRGDRRGSYTELVDPDDLRVDLYQRALDGDKVLNFVQMIRGGAKLSMPRASLREDGTKWVYDGQHRVEAHRLLGLPVHVHVTRGMTWGEEHDECRELMAKVCDPLLYDVDDVVAKEYLTRDEAIAAADRGGMLDAFAPAPAAPLDPLLFDGARMRSECAKHLRELWENVAGPDSVAWSRLYLPLGGRPEVVIDWPAMRAVHPEWRDLADTDLHMALVILAMERLADAELAPGVPLELRIRPEHTSMDYTAALEADADGGHVWSVDGQQWLGGIPAGAVEKTADTLFPEYTWGARGDAAYDALGPRLLGSDEYEALVAKDDGPATVGWHVAPRAARNVITGLGLQEAQPNDRWARYGAAAQPAGVYLWTSRARALRWARDMDRLVGPTDLALNDVWRVDLAGLAVHRDPVLGEQGAVYVPSPFIDPERLTLDDVVKAAEVLTELADVAKMSPAPAAPNAGVEHWITVHPHGDEAKGQAVLVRNNKDGTMTVIGGAGGNLNYLRIDPRRRISQGESKANDKTAGKPDNRILSAEEQARATWELAHARKQAQRTIEKSDAKIGDLQDQLRDYVEQTIGAKWLTHGLIRHASGETEEYELGFMERNQAMRKLVQGALQTLAVGELDRKDAVDAPYLFVERQGDFEGMPDAEKAPDEPIDAKAENGEVMEPDAPAPEKPTSASEDLEAEQRKINRRLPPLDAEQAQEVLRLERQIAKVMRDRSKARKVLKGDGDMKTALALEWTDSDVDDAVRKKVEAEQRTNAARELLDTSEKNTYKVSYGRNIHRGAYDTLDSFTNAVLGTSAVSPEVARLLGPEGTAQLIAHVIRQKATAVGDPDKLDLQKPLAALQGLTDKLEGDVANTACARARTAMDIGIGMRDERRKSEQGESLWTKTMATSYEIDKLNEASAQLGMAIGGFEAASALKVALEKPPKEIVVGGLESPSTVIDLAQRAGIDVKPGQIERNGSGNYTLRIPLDQASAKLAKLDRPPDWEKRELLKRIRTGKGMAREIEKARSTPGMVDQLSPAQAQGKMFLLASDEAGANRHWNLTGTPIEKKSEDLRAQLQLGTTLDFAPGVGKTHTAIAAAMQLMHDEPEKNHRVLVVAPSTAIGPWAATVQKQGALAAPDGGMGPVTVNALGYGMDVNGPGDVQLRRAGKGEKQAQLEQPAHFNIISHDQLKRDPEIAKKLGATIVVTDETQKFKNERNQRSNALREAGDAVDVERPKVPSRTAWAEKFGQLERGYEHITREDKVRQFREGIDDRLFHMTAEDAGNDLPGARKGDKDSIERLGFPHTRHEVTLDPEHMAELTSAVKNINETQADLKAQGRAGIPFGGQQILAKALYDRPGNAFAKKAAEVMDEALSGDMDWKGFQGHPKHADGEGAGTYAKKGIVFSQYTGTQLAHVIPELEGKGLKVFYAHGGLSNEDNDKVLAAYLKHKGRAVLVTSDKNSTARSLQFGDNNGRFQHGATEMLHYSLPDQGGNATIQQRNARILRRGAQAEVGYHTLWGNTPAELRQQDRLTRELKTQQMAGNSEQLVGGRDTLRHRLAREGVAPANELKDQAAKPEEETDERPAAA